MNHEKAIRRQRQRRRFRVRKRVQGTASQPRLTIFRSHRHMYAQLIDDTTGKTLASASTVEAELHKQVAYGGNIDAAASVGKAIAERGQEAGIKACAFDRGPCKYHGRVAALAEAAREAGLEF
ncbi:MAG: 50S ribosomal protein L18 [Pirellulales bacterium]|nr:50S ribosomal protein L18 [Pirellulales bacterium]HJN67256.1 50S ribosomal protein L18 [Pirellulales bacterium]